MRLCLEWRIPTHAQLYSLSAWQGPASHKSGKSLEAHVELTRVGWTTRDFLFGNLEFIDILGGKNNLVLKELSFGRGLPHRKVGREGD